MAIDMNNVSADKLRITTFNCRGLKNSLDDIVDMREISDILLLQEIWLCDSELDTFYDIHAEFYGKGISPVNTESNLLTGRPHAGVAILWRKSLGKCSKVVVFEHEKRIIGLNVSCDNKRETLIMNVYMPYMCADNKDLYLEYLGSVGAILQDAATSSVMILSDFNAGVHTYYEKFLLDFCDDNQMTISDYSFLPEGAFTYISNAHSTTSWLDHCICTQGVHKRIENISVGSRYVSSDRLPLMTVLNMDGPLNKIDQDKPCKKSV